MKGDLRRRLRRLEERPPEAPSWEEYHATQERSRARIRHLLCQLGGEPLPNAEADLLANDTAEQRARDEEVIIRWNAANGIEPETNGREKLDQLLDRLRERGAPLPAAAAKGV